MTFSEKVALVRSLYTDQAEIKDHPPSPKESSGNLGMASPTAKSRPVDSASLPWNPSTAKISKEANKRLTGADPKSKSSEAGGLGTSSYLKRPDFRERYYRVSGIPHPTLPAAVPLEFRQLQPASKVSTQPRISLSQSEATDVETQQRKLNLALSHQDWLFGSVRILAEQGMAKLKEIPEQFTQMVELLQSGTRAGFDAQQLSSHLTHNWVLRRRDAYLRETLSDLPDTAKRTLRQTDLESRQLFDPKICETVHKSHTEANLSRAAHRAAGYQGNQARRTERPSVMERNAFNTSRSNSWQPRGNSSSRGGSNRGPRGKSTNYPAATSSNQHRKEGRGRGRK